MSWFSFSKEMAMDLGTANTIIISNGKIVVDEPSVVALNRRTERMDLMTIPIDDRITDRYYLKEAIRAVCELIGLGF